MRFFLFFEGSLPSAANKPRTKEKHAIRAAMHLQLLELFRRNRNLPKLPDGRDWAGWSKWDWPKDWRGHGRHNFAWNEEDAVFSVGDLKFVPLVRENLALYCEIELLFLRYEEPGSIISAGDIDNRLLTLSDGLRLPKDAAEIQYACEQPEFPKNDPIFCLLEDDSLVTRWNIRTDRLLKSTGNLQSSEVRLILDVHVKASRIDFGNVDLSGD
jgi:hypothetical protein